MIDAIALDPAENVAVAVVALAPGLVAEVESRSVPLLEVIPAGHKFALVGVTRAGPC
jgi:hypothetical protein